MREAW